MAMKICAHVMYYRDYKLLEHHVFIVHTKLCKLNVNILTKPIEQKPYPSVLVLYDVFFRMCQCHDFNYRRLLSYTVDKKYPFLVIIHFLSRNFFMHKIQKMMHSEAALFLFIAALFLFLLFSVLTPYYSEETVYSKNDIEVVSD